MADSDVSLAKLLLAEYERVKDEQRTRIGFRDNLIYATLAAIAGVVAAVTSRHGGPETVLLLPPVSTVLGWTYLMNDQKVSAIGRYVRLELGPRLAAMIDRSDGVFGWESAHRSDRHRRSRKVGQLLVDLLTFCISGLVGLAVFWWSGQSGPLLALSIVEAVLVLALAVEIVRYADLTNSA